MSSADRRAPSKGSGSWRATEVISSWEIFLVFVTFAMVLYFLFPGDQLRKRVLEERSNYDLSGIYLENLLRLNPKDKEVVLAATHLALQEGNLHYAEKLLSVLKGSEDPEVKKMLPLLQAKVYNGLIESAEDPRSKEEYRRKLQALIREVAAKRSFNTKEAFLWYQLAYRMNDRNSAEAFLEPLIRQGDPRALRECAYIITEPENRLKRMHCIEALAQMKGSDRLKWLEAAWTYYASRGDYSHAARLLAEMSRIDPKYKKEYAAVLSAAGETVVAAQVYLDLAEHAPLERIRRENLIRAVETLIAGKRYKEASILIHRYEDRYLKDEEMTQKLIKLYLQMENLEGARRLSKKLLESEE